MLVRLLSLSEKIFSVEYDSETSCKTTHENKMAGRMFVFARNKRRADSKEVVNPISMRHLQRHKKVQLALKYVPHQFFFLFSALLLIHRSNFAKLCGICASILQAQYILLVKYIIYWRSARDFWQDITLSNDIFLGFGFFCRKLYKCLICLLILTRSSSKTSCAYPAMHLKFLLRIYHDEN